MVNLTTNKMRMFAGARKAVHKAKQKRIPSPLQHRNMPQK